MVETVVLEGAAVAVADTSALKSEIAELRREVDRLTEERDQLVLTELRHDSIYVLDDDTEEARAFDQFYRAYDEGHAKTRKFLLG